MKLYTNDETFKKTLGQGLKRARKESGFTQQELADELECTLISVRNWEQGIVEPKMSTLYKLCDFYNCDLDYLYGKIECKKLDMQFICDYTGLSEKTITKLNSWNKSEDRRKSWPLYISQIIDHKDFNNLMIRINDFFASSKIEGFAFKYGTKQDCLDSIDDQASMLWYISHEITNILEGLSTKIRQKACKKGLNNTKSD